jgi:hypothetical protein
VIDRSGSGYVKIHFTDLRILPGDVLTVSNPDGTEKYTYNRDLKASLTATVDQSGFWAMSIRLTGVVEAHAQGDRAPPLRRLPEPGRAHRPRRCPDQLTALINSLL